MSRKPSQNDELNTIIERFEAMKSEGKILYLDPEQYEDLVEYYIHEKRNKDAYEAISMGLKIHPHSTRLVALQVALYIDDNKLKEARQLMNNVLDDNSIQIRLIHAELLALEGEESKAEKVLASFREDTTDEIDCLDIAYFCIDMDFYEDALYWIERCLSINPENNEALATLCECYQNMGKPEETIEIFNKLIDKDPYSSEYWVGLAKSYFTMKNFEKAIEASDFAIVSDEKAGEAYTIKGHLYYQLSNYRESIEAYKEAWRLGNLENEFAPLFIAFNYIGLEEWDNAYEYLKKAIARTSEDSVVFPDLLVNSARCLHNMNRHEEAHSTLDFAAERYPDVTNIHLYNGRYYLKEGNPEKALESFEKAIDIEPSADTWFEIGVIALNNDEYDLAKLAFDNVKELDPNHEGLPENMDYVLRRMQEEEHIPISRKAIKKQIREMVERTGEKPILYDVEAHVRKAIEDGRSAEDISDLREALEKLNDILLHYDVDQEEDEIN